MWIRILSLHLYVNFEEHQQVMSPYTGLDVGYSSPIPEFLESGRGCISCIWAPCCSDSVFHYSWISCVPCFVSFWRHEPRHGHNVCYVLSERSGSKDDHESSTLFDSDMISVGGGFIARQRNISGCPCFLLFLTPWAKAWPWCILCCLLQLFCLVINNTVGRDMDAMYRHFSTTSDQDITRHDHLCYKLHGDV